MEYFRQMRERKREEREKEQAAGSSRQTRMEDFFRVTRKRAVVSITIGYEHFFYFLVQAIFKAQLINLEIDSLD